LPTASSGLDWLTFKVPVAEDGALEEHAFPWRSLECSRLTSWGDRRGHVHTSGLTRATSRALIQPTRRSKSLFRGWMRPAL